MFFLGDKGAVSEDREVFPEKAEMKAMPQRQRLAVEGLCLFPVDKRIFR